MAAARGSARTRTAAQAGDEVPTRRQRIDGSENPKPGDELPERLIRQVRGEEIEDALHEVGTHPARGQERSDSVPRDHHEKPGRGHQHADRGRGDHPQPGRPGTGIGERDQRQADRREETRLRVRENRQAQCRCRRRARRGRRSSGSGSPCRWRGWRAGIPGARVRPPPMTSQSKLRGTSAKANVRSRRGRDWARAPSPGGRRPARSRSPTASRDPAEPLDGPERDDRLEPGGRDERERRIGERAVEAVVGGPHRERLAGPEDVVDHRGEEPAVVHRESGLHDRRSPHDRAGDGGEQDRRPRRQLAHSPGARRRLCRHAPPGASRVASRAARRPSPRAFDTPRSSG